MGINNRTSELGSSDSSGAVGIKRCAVARVHLVGLIQV